MIYAINSKADFSAGAELSVKVNAADIDYKALYTIEAEKPQFILPFRYQGIDEQIEFVYQIGARHKLQYLTGSRSPQEYCELWLNIFTPLLECSDWFMNPFSFVLGAEHLYYDKSTKNISYIYIPSTCNCANNSDLKSLATELSRQITVTDANLENRVLRAIMEDFDVKDFVQMLKSYRSISIAGLPLPSQTQNIAEPSPLADEALKAQQGIPVIAQSEVTCPQDIIISMPTIEKTQKKTKNKPHKAQSGSGLFRKKKKNYQEITNNGAAKFYPEPQSEQKISPLNSSPLEYNDLTQMIDEEISEVGLRLVGYGPWPKLLHIMISDGEAFTVGRFDVSIGRKQSSFEFDKNTKAVSRRHAAIERDSAGYLIIDLSSSAGTFVDGHRLPPNMPYRLKRGDRVSFGNAGADYIWEESY
ncbi:MAG: FHA domain-containing protein [Firmicutes bacterium]|nr:FHA domain-containing protein [Bacillota bacterium]